jgi:hypothetical protein
MHGSLLGNGPYHTAITETRARREWRMGEAGEIDLRRLLKKPSSKAAAD